MLKQYADDRGYEFQIWTENELEAMGITHNVNEVQSQ